ncbi:Nepetalactol-related short-chain-dehydrogenase/reductase 1 [Sesamum alatum]|uniref:Nepetalactol-related short-chain-dehydrogenase/reductase 1 n=1 Tax=Sesamum alatum TaxID=300844 RepID=A0AAE2CWI5_9LAMI|nr:Nepetalactol-related short-chain-dehydrogenase/reductase 1 [Sesamum alatum]
MADTPSISLKKKLEGKVAIVTGGASGIGEATARLFAEHGARAVVIADIQAEKGQSVAESIGSQRCSYYQCDVADEEQVKSMVEWTVKTYGGVDILFSNAGIIGSSDQTILDLDFSEYDTVMRVNARGMAVCVKQAARKMMELGTKGAIVCTTSVLVVMAAQTLTDYTMSKHAVLGLVRAASQQLGAHGIRINCVSPSGVMTPMAKKIGLATAGDLENLFGPLTSLKGVALTAEHVAEALLFLASDDSAFITGHNLVVDGGLISMPFLKSEENHHENNY